MDPAAVSQLYAGGLSIVLRAALAAAVLAASCAAGASADIVAALNAARASGCPGKPGIRLPLRESAQLAEAAKRSVGSGLADALAAAGYRATRSLLIRVTGPAGAQGIANFVAGNYCAQLTEAAYTDVGIFQRGQETRILLAAPFSPPPPEAAPAIAARVLELVNLARAKPRTCGTASFPAARPLRLSDMLNRVSLAHATDMAQYSYLSHGARDGSAPADRLNRAGYRWRSVGENIASGATTAETVVTDWMNSPEHCANLMTAYHTEMGVAYAVNRDSKAGIYWVLMLAAPR